MTRILLTTVDRDLGLYDYYGENAPARFRWRFRMPRRISFGLRFLRQNVPEIEVLEYPTRTEYLTALEKGWDVVGFSFYLDESNHILEMAEQAHKAGVKRLWAGNYGALTPSVQASFDDIFSGYSEDAVAQSVGKTIEAVRHPPLVSEFRLPGGWPMPVGILFTTRGCSFTCTFCQTTAFAPRPKAIPIESVEEALQFYVAHGIGYVLILDENFGNIPQHAEAVIELLARYKVRWLVQSRVDLFLRHFDEWVGKGMEGALFGIESFHQDVLKQIHKGEKVEAVMELARRLNRAGKYAHGYYIIGFPSETAESIGEDLKTLAAMELDVTQITIVTPHPRTQLWDELDSKYGIFEKDLSRYDTKHLVWNHPNCKRGTLESLLKQGFDLCYGKDWLRRTMRKFLSSRLRRQDLSGVLFSPLHTRWAEPRRLPYLNPL
jgi:radical SAM superfamily enzyme YgiQ (UPF0313 family)